MPLTTQAALSFFISQTEHMEPEAYRQDFSYLAQPQLVDIDNSAGPFASAVSFMSVTSLGTAKLITPTSTDIPNADVRMAKSSEPVYMAGIGYETDMITLEQASMAGITLDTELAASAVRAYMEFLNAAAMTGIPGVDGSFGFANIPSGTVPISYVAEGAFGGTAPENRAWANKTGQEILADVNSILSASFVNSSQMNIADTLILPPAAYAQIAQQFLPDSGGMTVLEYIQRANIWTGSTGQPLRIVAAPELAGIGRDTSGVMVAYRKDRRNLRFHVPMEHRFLDALQMPGTLIFKRPGIFRLAGLDIRNTTSFARRDGI